jgi:hypothetical protein
MILSTLRIANWPSERVSGIGAQEGALLWSGGKRDGENRSRGLGYCCSHRVPPQRLRKGPQARDIGARPDYEGTEFHLRAHRRRSGGR